MLLEMDNSELLLLLESPESLAAKVEEAVQFEWKMAVPPTVPAAPASLYVGDLHHDVTDGQLFDHFSEFKSLASVRVCRDSSTGRSLCYGYVNFISPQDAIRSIEMKNHSLLNGKVIRVMWSLRDPDARKSGIGNVFVKNLGESIDNGKLQEMFEKIGTILSCKVVMSDDGKSKGYGFVQFDSEESANTAIEKYNGFSIGGKQMYVGKFVKKSDRILPSPDAKYTNLYIKNLDPDVTEEIFKEKFSEFGKIVSLVITKDDNGASRGSKVLYVARAQKKAEREQILRRHFEEKRKEQILKYQGSNVYVKNIDDDVTEDELREHFRQCGTITSAKLMRDDKGISRGFGFVSFSKPEEANKAVNTFHAYMFHRKPLYVAIAQRKEERHAQLQIQYAQHIAGLAGPSTVIPGGYPPFYYTGPPSVVSQVPPQPGLMYQPLGLRPFWRANGFAPPTRPGFQPSPLPVVTDWASKVCAKWTCARDEQGSAVSSAVSNSIGSGSEGSEMLSSRLAAASPEQQKQILGERLYPLVQKHKSDLAAKITGMLLEMDNSELLLLLESPESLAAKVEEAVQVLKLSKTKVSGQDSRHPTSYLSAEVAVN
ncbi:Polyadenylate-binding protein 7 [Camellia lanceoleosa]|uniref:Polyadenylate-binding protein 7 n=1 Tax=Camellia lanceoleosa TaxID=1840588 RepID=A0ACC0HIN0_9ERIC|nr:Polyadenylate-binding protein 7 [Camellia lanceoleosa]